MAVGLPCSSVGKESACSVGDPGLIPGSGRSPGEVNGNPLQQSYLENHGQRSLPGSPLSMGFPKQEHQIGLPFPSPGDLPDPGIETTSLALQVNFLLLSRQGSHCIIFRSNEIQHFHFKSSVHNIISLLLNCLPMFYISAQTIANTFIHSFNHLKLCRDVSEMTSP